MSGIGVTRTERPDLGGNLRHGDDLTFCPTLWRHLIERFCVHSVLDVGAGEGHAVDFFTRLGVYAVGIEGLADNIIRAVHPLVLHDLTLNPFVMPVDLVWSCEVAEHLDEEHVDRFLDTLANGKIVAMTAARPDQPGHHHVNCQPPEYWIAKMEWRGYTLSPLNDTIRAVAGRDGWNYFVNSGLVFLRR